MKKAAKVWGCQSFCGSHCRVAQEVLPWFWSLSTHRSQPWRVRRLGSFLSSLWLGLSGLVCANFVMSPFMGMSWPFLTASPTVTLWQGRGMHALTAQAPALIAL